jgi:hypothetical protein
MRPCCAPPRCRSGPPGSRCAVAVAAPAFVLTAPDPIAQLARHPLFGTLLVWMEALAITAGAEAGHGRETWTSPRG